MEHERHADRRRRGRYCHVGASYTFLSSVLGHAMTGKQRSIGQVVTTGRGRCADLRSPRYSNSALRCALPARTAPLSPRASPTTIWTLRLFYSSTYFLSSKGLHRVSSWPLLIFRNTYITLPITTLSITITYTITAAAIARPECIIPLVAVIAVLSSPMQH